MACAFLSVSIHTQETGQCSGEPSNERKQQHSAIQKPALGAPGKGSADVCFPRWNLQSSPPDVANRALSVLLHAIAKTLKVCMQSTTSDTMKTRARAVSSDNAKPTIVLNLPGVRLAILTSAYDSLLHLDVTLSSAASLLLATYVVRVLAWNVVSFSIGLFAQAAAFVFIAFYTFTGLAMLSMKTTTSSTAITYHDVPEVETKGFSALPTLPLLCVHSRISRTKTDDATASKRKELQAPAAPARRRVLAQLNRNRLLVNVVPGDMRRRVDMNLGEANIRVGKAFVQVVPGMRKPRDVYVVRVDCGAQSPIQEKHMNPVIMWDVTATFDEFKQLERDLKKEVQAKKQLCGAKVPHLSSGAVLFVQPKLTDHVLNARRARLQAFIDTVRSDSVLSTMGCLRKFCQAY